MIAFNKSLNGLLGQNRSVLYLGLSKLIINGTFGIYQSDIYTLFEGSFKEYFQDSQFHSLDCVNLFCFDNDEYVRHVLLQINQSSTVIIESPLILAIYRYLHRNKSTILDAFKSSADKQVCILPDIWPNIFNEIKILSECADSFISFSLDVSRFLSQRFASKRFLVLPSIPIPSSLTRSLRERATLDFNSRRYDLIYFGTSKPIRNHFIAQILSTAKTNGLSFKIICSDDRGNFNTYEEYLGAIAEGRFYLCSRNNDYYVYPTTKHPFAHKIGRAQYTGRVSEALSVGTIPLYIEPRYTYTLRPIDSFLRKLYLFTSYKYMNGSPFDFPIKGIIPFVTATSVSDLYSIINSPNKMKPLLEAGSNFFLEYIAPSSCFEKLYSVS